MHVRAAFNNGLTEDDIKEVILQAAIYCGVPAANHAFKEAAGGDRGARRRRLAMMRSRHRLARARRRGLAGDRRHAADVVADRRQGTPRPRPDRKTTGGMSPLYLTARGLTTSPIPDGTRAFQIDFDFIDHALVIATSDGGRAMIPLASHASCRISTPSFSRGLRGLGIDVRIWPVPVEVADAMPFTARPGPFASTGQISPSGSGEILLIADMALKRFRGDFLGKSSPAAFLLGQLRPGDDALLRAAGRPSTRAACPIWPTGSRARPIRTKSGAAASGQEPRAASSARPFTPTPIRSRRDSRTRPSIRAASYSGRLREFLLPYDEVRELADPPAAVHAFLQSTYEAAADRGGWDRAALRAP